MTRTITTAAELDALPAGSVVLGADHPAEPRRSLGERISARWDPDARWNVDGRHYYGAAETVLAVLGGAATVLHDPSAPAPAPSAVSDAAGLGDRIAALSARLAAVGFPACTCHPGDDDSERCLPSPQDWRAEIERAALSSTTLTAAPSATRDEATEDEVTEVVTEALTDAYRAERGMSRHTGLTAHDESVIRDQAAHVVSLADALFTITPKSNQ